MAAARHNRPTIIVYGGTIQAGTRHVGRSLVIHIVIPAVDVPNEIVYQWGTRREEQ